MKNWHSIVGPNGMCECGVKADGTVVTCGKLLDVYVREQAARIGAAALEKYGQHQYPCEKDGGWDSIVSKDAQCTCGLEAALEAIGLKA